MTNIEKLLPMIMEIFDGFQKKHPSYQFSLALCIGDYKDSPIISVYHKIYDSYGHHTIRDLYELTLLTNMLSSVYTREPFWIRSEKSKLKWEEDKRLHEDWFLNENTRLLKELSKND